VTPGIPRTRPAIARPAMVIGVDNGERTKKILLGGHTSPHLGRSIGEDHSPYGMPGGQGGVRQGRPGVGVQRHPQWATWCGRAGPGHNMDDRGVGGSPASSGRSTSRIWAERCLKALGEGDTVIDGSRSLAELAVFRRALGSGLRLVAIHSSPGRGSSGYRGGVATTPPRTRGRSKRGHARAGLGLGSLIALADVMLVNEGTWMSFREAVAEELRRPGEVQGRPALQGRRRVHRADRGAAV
jgi:hypothetical protein